MHSFAAIDDVKRFNYRVNIVTTDDVHVISILRYLARYFCMGTSWRVVSAAFSCK